jgi:hypothetical protein
VRGGVCVRDAIRVSKNETFFAFSKRKLVQRI